MSASVLTAGTPVDNLTTQPNDFTFTVPAGAVAGDIVYVGTSLNSGTDTCATPAGWTLMEPSILTASNMRSYLFGRKLDAADTDASKGVYTFTWTGGGRLTAAYQIVTGGDTLGEVIVESAGGTGGSTINSQTAATAEAGTICSHFWFGRAAVAVPVVLTPSNSPITQTKDAESNTNIASSPNFSLMVSHRTQVGTAPGTWASTAADSNQSLSHDHVYTIVTTAAAASNIVPIANAGVDQVNIEPYTTVTLTGTSSDPDGTIASSSWSQIPQAGVPTMTLVGTGASRTTKMLGNITGYTAIFQYSVTDNSGATTVDTVNVTVLPVTERAAIGGVLVPMEVRSA